MEQRVYPWRDRPTELVRQRMDEAVASRLFLVQERGPTSFVVMSDDRRKYRVLIGAQQQCSCRDVAELCIHLLFVMIKVLRVPADNPLAWQRSLLDSEVSQILAGKHLRMSARTAPPRPAGPHGTRVLQRPLDDDDSCPICMDQMHPGQDLSYCRSSCGNSFHLRCIQVYAQHKQSMKEPVTCPLCRTDNFPQPAPARLPKQATCHARVQCAACGTRRMCGVRWTCALCPVFDLCEACSRTQIKSHPHRTAFVVKRSPLDRAFTAACDDRPLAAALAAMLPQGAGDGNCVYCVGECPGDTRLRSLPCGHVAHHGCIVAEADRDPRVVCGIDGCVAFPGLAPRRRAQTSAPSVERTPPASAEGMRGVRLTPRTVGDRQHSIVMIGGHVSMTSARFGRRASGAPAAASRVCKGLTLAGRSLTAGPSRTTL